MSKQVICKWGDTCHIKCGHHIPHEPVLSGEFGAFEHYCNEETEICHLGKKNRCKSITNIRSNR